MKNSVYEPGQVFPFLCILDLASMFFLVVYWMVIEQHEWSLDDEHISYLLFLLVDNPVILFGFLTV